MTDLRNQRLAIWVWCGLVRIDRLVAGHARYMGVDIQALLLLVLIANVKPSQWTDADSVATCAGMWLLSHPVDQHNAITYRQQ